MNRGFILKKLPMRTIMIVLGTMIGLHLILVAYYTQEHKLNEDRMQRNAAIQQVLNITNMAQATPQSQLASAIQAINQPNLTVTLTQTPQHHTRVTDLTYWRLNRLVPLNAKRITLSLHIDGTQWLNITAKITHQSIWAQLFLLLFEGIIAFIILFYIWSISRFTKPLKQFQAAAERLGVDIQTTQLEEYQGPSIIRETAQAMNKMQQRIKDLIDNRTLILAAISHDLRTPITRLRLRLNNVSDKHIQEKSIADLNEMDTMLSEVLSFAKEEYALEEKTKLDLHSFLETICDEFSDLGSDVTYQGPNKRLPVFARRVGLKRAFVNLIQNAVKYGQQAHIQCLEKGDKIVVIIEDDGPGIPDAELKAVFTPFYRCDRSRSRKIAGTGLGLTVTRNTILAHHGTIRLENRSEGGLRAIVELQCWRPCSKETLR